MFTEELFPANHVGEVDGKQATSGRLFRTNKNEKTATLTLGRRAGYTVPTLGQGADRNVGPVFLRDVPRVVVHPEESAS